MNWKYLKAVLRHKFHVYRAGRALGLGRWRLLIHDWQKFLPVEWVPYARAFYGKPGRKPEGRPDFDHAWLHHQKFGPHHWQYWILLQDDGKHRPLPMPRVYLLEMCADWRGANAAYGDQPLLAWYTKTARGRWLHPDTQREVERILFGQEVLVNGRVPGWKGEKPNLRAAQALAEIERRYPSPAAQQLAEARERLVATLTSREEMRKTADSPPPRLPAEEVLRAELATRKNADPHWRNPPPLEFTDEEVGEAVQGIQAVLDQRRRAMAEFLHPGRDT